MAKSTPTVRDGTLHLAEGKTINLSDSEAWRNWLDEARTFRFEGQGGTFTARRDGRTRGGAYWSAFRRKYHRNFRAYLGKSERLTIEILEDAAANIQAEIRSATKRRR